MEQSIQKAVARADIWLCAEWQWIVAVVAVFVVAVAAILIINRRM